MPFTCTHPSAQTYRKSAEMDQNINRWTRKCRVRMHAILIAIDAETQALMSTAAPQALRHGRLLHMLLAAPHSMLSPQRTKCGTVTPGTPSKPRFKGYVASTTHAATHKHTHTHTHSARMQPQSSLAPTLTTFSSLPSACSCPYILTILTSPTPNGREGVHHVLAQLRRISEGLRPGIRVQRHHACAAAPCASPARPPPAAPTARAALPTGRQTLYNIPQSTLHECCTRRSTCGGWPSILSQQIRCMCTCLPRHCLHLHRAAHAWAELPQRLGHVGPAKDGLPLPQQVAHRRPLRRVAAEHREDGAADGRAAELAAEVGADGALRRQRGAAAQLGNHGMRAGACAVEAPLC